MVIMTIAFHCQEMEEDEEVGPKMEEYFKEVLDVDQNEFLDVEEIAQWVEPEGLVRAKSETVFIMEALDENNDKILTKEEILVNPKPFLNSQATFFGQMYKLKNLRQEVLHVNRIKK